jgi:hypothetical protein
MLVIGAHAQRLYAIIFSGYSPHKFLLEHSTTEE